MSQPKTALWVGYLAGLSIALLVGGLTLSQAKENLSAEQIIKRVDRNMLFDTAEILSEMTVYEAGELIIYQKIKSYVDGRRQSFAEVLAPARDAGTKFLKITENQKDLMWMYLPGADRSVKLAGHLLRQSMLGSDFSYEDVMEGARPLNEVYNLELVGEDTVRDLTCYKIILTAREKNVTYPRRILWIDMKHFIAIREERYSRQDKLLKQATVLEIGQFGERWFPTRTELRDMLRKTTRTEYNIIDLKLNLPLKPELFSRANLK